MAEPSPTNTTTETNHLIDNAYEAYALFNIRDQKTKPLCVTVSQNDHAVQMQVDTEASIFHHEFHSLQQGTRVEDLYATLTGGQTFNKPDDVLLLFIQLYMTLHS